MSEHLADLRETVAEAIWDSQWRVSGARQRAANWHETKTYANDDGPYADVDEGVSGARGDVKETLKRADAALAAIRDAGYCVVRRDDVRSVVCQPCQPAMPGTAIHRLRAAVVEGDGA